MSRTEIIKLRVTPAEKKEIQRRAGGPRQASEYIRGRALGNDAQSIDWPEFTRRAHAKSRRVPLARALREAREELGL